MDDAGERFRKAYWAAVHSADPLRLRVWESRGLTLPQLRILFYVRAHPGTTTGVLAAHFGFSAPTVSSQVDRLVRGGLMARGVSPDDRRIIPLCLTDDGQEVVGEIREGNDAHLACLARTLGDQLEAVTSALEAVAAADTQVRDQARIERAHER